MWQKSNIVIFILSCIILVLLWLQYKGSQSGVSGTHSINKHKTAIAIHSDKKLSELKKEDRALYDSIKRYGNKVNTVYKVKYVYEHTTDTIYLDTITQPRDSIYNYSLNTDSVDTNVRIKADNVKWVKIDTRVKDSITIINLKEGKTNTTYITNKNDARVEIQTAWSRKEKFFDRFSVGPSIGVGYGIFNKNIDVYAGITLSYKF